MHEKIILCLNGDYLPSVAASLPVSDRGVRFGDGVFETIRLIQGVPYQWELHMARLLAGLAALRIQPPAADWRAVAREVIARNSAQKGFLRIQVTRGSGGKGYMPDDGIQPNWFMEYQPAPPSPARPYTLWRSSIERPSTAAFPVNHKLTQGVGSTLALLEARDHQCDEALLLTHHQHVCEAAAANLFWITDGQFFTPALSTGCLAGTTRAAVMRLCGVTEVVRGLEALESAEATFITNVRLGIWPVAAIEPMGWRYDVAHPLLGEAQATLAADYEACGA